MQPLTDPVAFLTDLTASLARGDAYDDPITTGSWLLALAAVVIAATSKRPLSPVGRLGISLPVAVHAALWLAPNPADHAWAPAAIVWAGAALVAHFKPLRRPPLQPTKE